MIYGLVLACHLYRTESSCVYQLDLIVAFVFKIAHFTVNFFVRKWEEKWKSVVVSEFSQGVKSTA